MLADTVQGNDYFEKFNFFTGNDLQLTQGLVNYVDLQTAKNTNLSYVDGNNFVMRVDTTQVQEQGRPSVRIESKQSYTDAVIVLQVSHIPTGCAVWPAFWTVSKNQQAWPAGGEIDIIENVNDQYPYNLGSAHVQVCGNMTDSRETVRSPIQSRQARLCLISAMLLLTITLAVALR